MGQQLHKVVQVHLIKCKAQYVAAVVYLNSPWQLRYSCFVYNTAV